MTVRDSSGAVVQFLFGEDGLDPTMASLLGERWYIQEDVFVSESEDVTVSDLKSFNTSRRSVVCNYSWNQKYFTPIQQIQKPIITVSPVTLFLISSHFYPLTLIHLLFLSLSSSLLLSLITTLGGKPNQMQFLARNHQAVSHKYSMHEGLFTHGVNYELAVEHHDRMKQAKKMMAKGIISRISPITTSCYTVTSFSYLRSTDRNSIPTALL